MPPFCSRRGMGVPACACAARSSTCTRPCSRECETGVSVCASLGGSRRDEAPRGELTLLSRAGQSQLVAGRARGSGGLRARVHPQRSTRLECLYAHLARLYAVGGRDGGETGFALRSARPPRSVRPASAASSSNSPRFRPKCLHSHILRLSKAKTASIIQPEKSRVTVARARETRDMQRRMCVCSTRSLPLDRRKGWGVAADLVRHGMSSTTPLNFAPCTSKVWSPTRGLPHYFGAHLDLGPHARTHANRCRSSRRTVPISLGTAAASAAILVSCSGSRTVIVLPLGSGCPCLLERQHRVRLVLVWPDGLRTHRE